MGGLSVQNNVMAINALKNVNINLAGLQKATARLASGFRINCAADDAAGLAISEKMRSQIRGLDQALRNTNDAISLLQTAEGGLNESHAILQRMRELAVQSSNGTYTEDDRAAIQLEVDALKEEIDRISGATEFNTMKLLDGSLSGSGSSTEYGALYGFADKDLDIGGGRITTSSTVAGMKINFTTDASGAGGENAIWSSDGKEVTVNLAKGKAYTDDEINKLIKNATVPKELGMSNPYGSITFKSEHGIITAAKASTSPTVAGVRQVIGTVAAANTAGNLKELISDQKSGALGSSDNIVFTANTYGGKADYDKVVDKINIVTDVGAGKESAEYKKTDDGGEVTLHLSTGVRYSEKDIESLLRKAGVDYSVSLTDGAAPDGSDDGYVYFNVKGAVSIDEAVAGKGAGNEDKVLAGEGITFQIGANGTEDQRVTLYIDDMGADALGIDDVDVSTREGANAAIGTVDSAISKVSMQRAAIGALQNRLEHTVNSLTTAKENLTDAESRIRDADMAKEMMNYTKFNILFQAAQAMLAQAIQQPQSLLQLLG